MTKTEFLELLGEAYDFPDYYAHNLDSADEILADRLADRLADTDAERLPLQPFFARLLQDVPATEREPLLDMLGEYFG